MTDKVINGDVAHILDVMNRGRLGVAHVEDDQGEAM